VTNSTGKLFHTTGSATEKALSPNFVLVYVEQSSWCRSSYCTTEG